jgi:hypothetical protein
MLYYDRLLVGQSVLVSGTHMGPATNFSHSFFNLFYTVTGLLMWGALSDERSGRSLQLLLGIFLGSESRETREHILLSQFLRLPQPWGPGSCIYFPQEDGSPVIPTGIGFNPLNTDFLINTIQKLSSYLTLRLPCKYEPVNDVLVCEDLCAKAFIHD